jgi:hypothetical protein
MVALLEESLRLLEQGLGSGRVSLLRRVGHAAAQSKRAADADPGGGRQESDTHHPENIAKIPRGWPHLL